MGITDTTSDVGYTFTTTAGSSGDTTDFYTYYSANIEPFAVSGVALAKLKTCPLYRHLSDFSGTGKELKKLLKDVATGRMRFGRNKNEQIAAQRVACKEHNGFHRSNEDEQISIYLI